MIDKLDERPESVQKCPFCGEELSYAQEIDGGFEILTCDCPYGIWFFGNDKMWNFLDRLIAQADKAERLQKAVFRALDALDDIQMTYGVQYDNGAIRFRDAKDIAVRSKKEIKQLIKGE